MIRLPCHGIHKDEVGLRYLVQEDSVTNAFGFNTKPNFKVRGAKYTYECPHSYEIKDFGMNSDDELIKFLSPIPSETKAMVYEGDAADLGYLARFSQSSTISGWMLNSYMRERVALASNIHLTIIQGCSTRNSEMIDEMQEAMRYAHGKVIFHGDYYFTNRFPVIEELPQVTDPEKVGASVMFNYLKERD